MPPPFITRVRLKNYKSIGYCDVELQALTFLVGPNGSGKSNFLDAIRFVSDGLRNSLDQAMRDHGGAAQMKHFSDPVTDFFAIRIGFQLSEIESGFFAIELAVQPDGAYFVRDEQCSLRSQGERFHYRVRDGIVDELSGLIMPPAARDRLYLVNAAGLPGFRPIYDALSQMGWYNISPDSIRGLEQPGPIDILARDGRNVLSVFARMSKRDPRVKVRVEKFLSQVVPGVVGADFSKFGEIGLPPGFLSDGTIRAFGILVALFQFGLTPDASHRLIGIEEPESGLHPGAAGILFDAIQDASQRLQVIVTTHSPELVEDKSLPVESILAVVSENGETQIGPIDNRGREILREKLSTAGELLRMDRLTPDSGELERRRSAQGSFFEAPVE
jgi:predicted ATPase